MDIHQQKLMLRQRLDRQRRQDISTFVRDLREARELPLDQRLKPDLRTPVQVSQDVQFMSQWLKTFHAHRN